jgi:UDP-2,3-diacylglucosamine hydrolase
MRIVFFSDTHLTDSDSRKTEFVIKFIRDVCGDADAVFILGDLFEFYHGYDDYIYPWYRSIVEALRKVNERGTSVHFLEGNHEYAMGRYFQSCTGVICAREADRDIEGRRVFIAHGDAYDRLTLEKLLRSRLVYGVMNVLGPTLSWKTAMWLRYILSKRKKPQKVTILNRYRKYARAKLAEGYDVVILAHSHMSDMWEFNSGGQDKMYLNTGDLAEYGTYVEYESGTGFRVKKYSSG